MRSVEATGKDVEEAVANALQELGAEQDSVDIDIIDAGDGAGEARVRVSHSMASETMTHEEAQERVHQEMGEN